jgi:Sigma-70, region 4
MAALEPLAPDQRAVVSLVLQQGRSYGEIADLLGIPVDAVQGRAHAGLAALAPANGLPGELTGPIADYLLRQQDERDAEATRALLSESAPARTWAAAVAERLAGVAPGALPEVPDAKASEAAAPAPAPDGPAAEATEIAPLAPAPRPRPVREPTARAPADPDAPAPASRIGGILLIVGVLAVVAVVLVIVLGGGSDDEQPAAGSGGTSAQATATPTATPGATPVDEIVMRPPGGGKPQGVMAVYVQQDGLTFQFGAQNLRPRGNNAYYGIWLTGNGGKAHRLGFATADDNGTLVVQGPSEREYKTFPKLYASYEKVVLSRETTDKATRPSAVVLVGKLPKGR